ncbi:MAG: hypothetical protein A3K19_06235 [Lentisphaerae bacterium RIFOXYB12_FULL_65_16]|nr:MAG: hypothetical protein A3K18_30965 [Lentisphaerae bacterium RIFOXYA12_64_32]OGV91995.1 MAG: hypothetical protein A3K19_06235 [Lentisphaerae bacterium RIFOXYB12_FULL_65_16]
MRTLVRLTSLAAFLLTCGSLFAQDMAAIQERMKERIAQVAALKTQKVVGENRVGLLEIVKPEAADDAARKVVEAENADRKLVYAAIGAKTGAGADKVGTERAKKIAESATPGVMLQREDGSWYAK